MQNQKMEEYVDLLLAAAIKKCGNLADAEDLVQETFMSALKYLHDGNEVKDWKAFLVTVMNRKFYDALREKYRQPMVGIDAHPDLLAQEALICRDEYFFDQEDERIAEVKNVLSHLSKIYREVIVRYYMRGQSVAQIAKALDIPEGTVKSRLSLGRDHIKKEMEHMEKKIDPSYAPVSLSVSCSGQPGRNGEPMSLVNNDLAAQNILWFAYEKPVSVEEISKATGIPAAYVEPIVKRLVCGGLMKDSGRKYYTDFMISTLEDRERWIPEQKKMVRERFSQFWEAIHEGLGTMRKLEFYQGFSLDAGNSLEMYFAFKCLDYGFYQAFCRSFDTEQIFPDRSDGGAWIAFGNVYTEEFDYAKHWSLMESMYSGERWVQFDNYAGSRRIELHVYGAEGFPAYQYDRSPEYDFFRENDDIDAEITKLLYLIHTGTDAETVGYPVEYLKAIPWLERCKILIREKEGLRVNIPVLSREACMRIWQLAAEVKEQITEDIREMLAKFYRGKKQQIPKHIGSVPLFKQYMHAGHALLFAAIREAIRRGELYDGKYDEENQFPCPMILMIDR